MGPRNSSLRTHARLLPIPSKKIRTNPLQHHEQIHQVLLSHIRSSERPCEEDPQMQARKQAQH